jgi:hypothetical protein
MTQAPVTLYCRQCGQALTGPLRFLAEAARLELLEGQPLLPRGCYTRGDTLARPDIFRPDSTELLTRREDLLAEVSPGGTRIGCCGIDGLDGPNLFCQKGHPVGTEVSDCWTPHYVHLSLSNITTEEPRRAPRKKK